MIFMNLLTLPFQNLTMKASLTIPTRWKTTPRAVRKKINPALKKRISKQLTSRNWSSITQETTSSRKKTLKWMLKWNTLQ